MTVQLGSFERKRQGNATFGVPLWVQLLGEAPPGVDPLQIMEAAPEATGIDVTAISGTHPTERDWRVLLDPLPTQELLVRWLSDLGERLEATGCRGVIAVPPRQPLPDWFFRPHDPRDPPPHEVKVLAAGFDWMIDPDRLIRTPNIACEWAVPPEPTTAIIEALHGWARQGGPSLMVEFTGGDSGPVPDDHQIIDMWHRTVAGPSRFCLVGSNSSTRRGRLASTIPHGRSMLQHHDEHATWTDVLGALRQPLVALAPHAQTAFIRYQSRAHVDWLNKTMFLTPSHTKMWKHLLADHLYFPSGTQILTRAHLDQDPDLTDWTVTEVAPDRYLVEANDLEPWYGQHPSDPDVVDQALQDFEPLILTDAICDANPPPWRTYGPLPAGVEPYRQD